MSKRKAEDDSDHSDDGLEIERSRRKVVYEGASDDEDDDDEDDGKKYEILKEDDIEGKF